jgi:hypothetical protein
VSRRARCGQALQVYLHVLHDVYVEVQELLLCDRLQEPLWPCPPSALEV